MLAPVGRESRILQQHQQIRFIAHLIEQDIRRALHRQFGIGSVYQLHGRVRRDHALFQHPQQPATTATQLHHLRHLAIAKALVELEAGGSWLTYLDQRLAESIDIANAGLHLGQPETGEVLAKGGRLPGCTWRRQAQCSLPGLPPEIVIGRIVVERPIRATVVAQVTLLIPFQTGKGTANWCRDRLLVNGAGEAGHQLGATTAKKGDPHTHPPG